MPATSDAITAKASEMTTAESAMEPLELSGHKLPILSVAVSGDSRWLVSTCLLTLLYATAAKHRDAKQALLYAQRACDLTESKDWTCLDALAAAQAEAGQFDEAVKTIEQAADLTFADRRQQCLDRQKLYAQRQPLRLDWK